MGLRGSGPLLAHVTPTGLLCPCASPGPLWSAGACHPRARHLAPTQPPACASPGRVPARRHRNASEDDIVIFLHRFPKLLSPYPGPGSIFSQLRMNKFKKMFSNTRLLRERPLSSENTK